MVDLFDWLVAVCEYNIRSIVLGAGNGKSHKAQRIQATDGVLSVADTFNISVTNLNDAPGIPSILYPTANDTFFTDTLMIMWSRAVDVDQDPLTYLWSFSGNMVNVFGNTTDTIVRIPGNYVVNAPYSLILRAYDGLDTGGTASVTVYRGNMINVVEYEGTIPDEVMLFPNYPNPFNPSTTIRFGLPAAMRVRISVYNIFGQKVKDIAHRNYNAGIHTSVWDGRDETNNVVASGIYIFRLETPKTTLYRKTLLLK